MIRRDLFAQEHRMSACGTKRTSKRMPFAPHTENGSRISRPPRLIRTRLCGRFAFGSALRAYVHVAQLPRSALRLSATTIAQPDRQISQRRIARIRRRTSRKFSLKQASRECRSANISMNSEALPRMIKTKKVVVSQRLMRGDQEIFELSIRLGMMAH